MRLVVPMVAVLLCALYAATSVNGQRTGRRELALIHAARQGDIDALRAARLDEDLGVDRLRQGMTLLMHASAAGSCESARLLIDRGADVDIVSPSGWTALMIASVQGHADVVRMLLDAGADPTIRSPRGLTAAELARDRRGCAADPIASGDP